MRIADTADFSPALIFSCGQCFRFNEVSEGVWQGTAYGKVLRISGDTIECSEQEYEDIWRKFLDMDTDYAAIRKAVAINSFMSEAVDYGKGIRILRQDFWEALCSFIISQQNNIPRIKGIIHRLCKGESPFPNAAEVACMSEQELRELGMGYRAPYVLNAARAVVNGEVSERSTKEELMKLHGIGEKVASCVLLYGCHQLDVFPVDTWMRRGINKYFPENFSPAEFGGNAGVAQQYIFHYVRHLHGVKGV